MVLYHSYNLFAAEWKAKEEKAVIAYFRKYIYDFTHLDGKGPNPSKCRGLFLNFMLWLI